MDLRRDATQLSEEPSSLIAIGRLHQSPQDLSLHPLRYAYLTGLTRPDSHRHETPAVECGHSQWSSNSGSVQSRRPKLLGDELGLVVVSRRMDAQNEALATLGIYPEDDILGA